MKKHIPNAITSLNLFTGCIAVIYALSANYTAVFYCLLVCGVFDFFDGTAARLLKVKSAIGKELDSLADVVSFGLVPGMVVYAMLRDSDSTSLWPYVAFLITIFSAIRLAKFNIDERQTTDFIGVNTPMNSFFIISLPFLRNDYPTIFGNPYLLAAIVVLVCYLLISEVRLFSMKFSDLSWGNNKFKFLFLLSALLLIVLLKFLAVPLIFALYFLFSYLHFRSVELPNGQ